MFNRLCVFRSGQYPIDHFPQILFRRLPRCTAYFLSIDPEAGKQADEARDGGLKPDELIVRGRRAAEGDEAQAALRARPDYLNPLCIMAASSALAGNLEDASKKLAHMRQIDPGARISNIQQRCPFRRPHDLAGFGNGLRLAGLPE